MSVSANAVKELREKTGAGIMDCKAALAEAKGDAQKAVEILRQKGLAAAQKREGRATSEGLIASYIHAGGKIGVLLEINCETDFVAKTPDFISLAKDIAMQVAAANPTYVRRDEVPQEIIEKEKDIYRAQAQGTKKPPQVIEKIVDGKIEKYFQETCLMEQPFIRDSNLTVSDLIKEMIATIGENIMVKRFCRYRLGENSEGI